MKTILSTTTKTLMLTLSLSIGGLSQSANADNGAVIHSKLAPFGSCALLNAGIEWEYLYTFGRTCRDHSTKGMTKENGRDMVMAMIKAADTKTINNQYLEHGSSYSIMWVALVTGDAEMVKLLADKGAILDDAYIGFGIPSVVKKFYESTDPKIQEAIKALKEARAKRG